MAISRIMPSMDALKKKGEQMLKKHDVYLTVPVEDVISKPQARRSFRNIDELAQSMLEVGQLTPINVTPKDKDGKYTIIQGERRWRALKKAGIATINVCIIDEKFDEQELLIRQITENEQRDNMDPMDLCEAFERLKATGLSNGQIGKRIGKNRAYVWNYCCLADMHPEARAIKELWNITALEPLLTLRKLFIDDPVGAKNHFDTYKEDGIRIKELLDSEDPAKQEEGRNLYEELQNNGMVVNTGAIMRYKKFVKETNAAKKEAGITVKPISKSPTKDEEKKPETVTKTTTETVTTTTEKKPTVEVQPSNEPYISPEGREEENLPKDRDRTYDEEGEPKGMTVRQEGPNLPAKMKLVKGARVVVTVKLNPHEPSKLGTLATNCVSEIEDHVGVVIDGVLHNVPVTSVYLMSVDEL